MLVNTDPRSLPELPIAELGEGLWLLTEESLLSRWRSRLVMEDVAPDVARAGGEFSLGDPGVECSITWTFADGRLAVVRVTPLEGRAALDRLVHALGVAVSALSPDGEGVESVELEGRRVDVDRLDGVICLYEVPT